MKHETVLTFWKPCGCVRAWICHFPCILCVCVCHRLWGSVIGTTTLTCPATLGWLEPLLRRIALDPHIVVCPVIDVISDDDFEYHYRDSSGVNVGGFDWNLQVWLPGPSCARPHSHSRTPVTGRGSGSPPSFGFPLTWLDAPQGYGDTHTQLGCGGTARSRPRDQNERNAMEICLCISITPLLSNCTV